MKERPTPAETKHNSILQRQQTSTLKHNRRRNSFERKSTPIPPNLLQNIKKTSKTNDRNENKSKKKTHQPRSPRFTLDRSRLRCVRQDKRIQETDMCAYVNSRVCDLLFSEHIPDSLRRRRPRYDLVHSCGAYTTSVGRGSVAFRIRTCVYCMVWIESES